MRGAFIFSVLLFCFINSDAQSKNDDSLSAYITGKNYIKLTDTTMLPSAIKSYYPAITSCVKRFDNVNAWYIPAQSISDRQGMLSMILLNIEGIKLERKLASTETTTDTIINGQKYGIQHINSVGGNASGKDGVLIIDKTTRKITYKLFQ